MKLARYHVISYRANFAIHNRKRMNKIWILYIYWCWSNSVSGSGLISQAGDILLILHKKKRISPCSRSRSKKGWPSSCPSNVLHNHKRERWGPIVVRAWRVFLSPCSRAEERSRSLVKWIHSRGHFFDRTKMFAACRTKIERSPDGMGCLPPRFFADSQRTRFVTLPFFYYLNVYIKSI